MAKTKAPVTPTMATARVPKRSAPSGCGPMASADSAAQVTDTGAESRPSGMCMSGEAYAGDGAMTRLLVHALSGTNSPLACHYTHAGRRPLARLNCHGDSDRMDCCGVRDRG